MVSFSEQDSELLRRATAAEPDRRSAELRRLPERPDERSGGGWTLGEKGVLIVIAVAAVAGVIYWTVAQLLR